MSGPAHGALVAGALLVPSLALADPIALRAPGGGVTVVAAGTALSAGMWLGADGRSPTAPGSDPTVGLAIEADPSGGPLGAWVAVKRTALRRPRGFGVEGTLAGGLLLPLTEPAITLGITPAGAVGWRGRRVDAVLDLAVPAVLRAWPEPAVRLPVVIEPWLGVHVGPVTVGLGGGMGVAYTTGEPYAITMRGQVSLAYAFGL